jgi:hypothetical protein
MKNSLQGIRSSLDKIEMHIEDISAELFMLLTKLSADVEEVDQTLDQEAQQYESSGEQRID